MDCKVYPITGVNIKRFLISSIVGFLFIYAYDYVVHGNLLAEMYEATAELWRTEEEMPNYFMWMGICQVLVVLIIGLIYTRNHEGKGIAEGVRFGIMIGALLAVMNMSMYAYMPIPCELCCAWGVAGLFKGIGLGIIFSLLYKK